MTAGQSKFARKRQVACKAILDATSALIAEKGVDGFTLSEVARRAPINRALIYHYFKSRDNLVAQAISHILSRYQAAGLEAGVEAIEGSLRMHIEHPEIARFFFQMLLNDRSLQGLGPWLREAIAALERFQQTSGLPAGVDPTFVGVIAMLTQLSWAFSRQEMARLLEMSVEEADERFIAQVRRRSSLTTPASPS